MDPKIKQKVLRLLTNGMYVLTSRSAKRFGAATITWVSQASFKPPLLMVALRKDGSAFQCVVESRAAVLHVLDSGQQRHRAEIFRGDRGNPRIVERRALRGRNPRCASTGTPGRLLGMQGSGNPRKTRRSCHRGLRSPERDAAKRSRAANSYGFALAIRRLGGRGAFKLGDGTLSGAS